jgi:putative effector of murein hydrolase
MIQRIQSVYLLIAACIQIAVFFLVWSSYFVDDQSFFLTGLESSVGSISAMPLTLSIAVSIALMLATLISFKNRASQMRLANIVMLQLLLVFGIFGFAHYQIIQTIKESFGQVEIGYGLAVATPFISMILIWLAKKAIKKDDDLVKSVDRLR